MRSLVVLALLAALGAGCGSVEDEPPRVVTCPTDASCGSSTEIQGAGGQTLIYTECGDVIVINVLTSVCCVEASPGYVPDGTECTRAKS